MTTAIEKTHKFDQQIRDRNGLFSDRGRLMEKVMEHFRRLYLIREGAVGDRAAIDVLRERLAALPWPEFRLAAAYILRDDVPHAADAGPAFWLEAAEKDDDSSTSRDCRAGRPPPTQI
jgi:hypothetical protein